MERPGYHSSGQLRVRTCSCGCLFDLETAKSHSLYDHSRPELCFACQVSSGQQSKMHWDLLMQKAAKGGANNLNDNDEKPYDFEVRSVLLSGSI